MPMSNEEWQERYKKAVRELALLIRVDTTNTLTEMRRDMGEQPPTAEDVQGYLQDNTLEFFMGDLQRDIEEEIKKEE